jgi:hypothetical protein
MSAPRKAHPEAKIAKRLCGNCGTEMDLSRMEPDDNDYDLFTYECPKCCREETVKVGYQLLSH